MQPHDFETIIDNRNRYLNMPLTEKRNVYACRNEFKNIQQFDKWPIYFNKKELFKSKST